MEKKKNTPKLRFPEFTGEWEEKKLGEIFRISAGGDIDSKHVSKERTERFNYPIYANTERDKGLYGYSDVYKIESGVVTVTGRGVNIGIAHARNHRFYPIVRLLVLEPLKEENVYFYEYQINRLNLYKESTGVPQLTAPQISIYCVCFPQLIEQTKIASFLTAVDEKLTQLKKKKTLLEQYKKGVMQKLFSQELRFKDDNNQDFPDWQEKLLGEICELITKGTTPTSIGFNFTEEGVKFIKVESLTEFGEIIPAKVAYISNECHQALKRSQLKVNDILFSIAGALGRVGIVKQEIVPSNTNQALAIIRLSENSDMLVSFLAKYLVSDFIVKEIESLKAGAAQLNLSLEQLNRLIIPIPSLPEQQKIANFLSSIDEKISHCGAQIEKMEAWKKGLLQQMFC